jgi:hypothetical protein
MQYSCMSFLVHFQSSVSTTSVRRNAFEEDEETRTRKPDAECFCLQCTSAHLQEAFFRSRHGANAAAVPRAQAHRLCESEPAACWAVASFSSEDALKEPAMKRAKRFSRAKLLDEVCFQFLSTKEGTKHKERYCHCHVENRKNNDQRGHCHCRCRKRLRSEIHASLGINSYEVHQIPQQRKATHSDERAERPYQQAPQRMPDGWCCIHTMPND